MLLLVRFTFLKENINAGQVNSNNVRRTLWDDQIYASFKNVKGTPQYGHNMKLDILMKVRHFGTSTLEEFHWPEGIQIVAHQYGTKLSADHVKQMDRKTKVMWLKRNPVTVAWQIDYIFRQVFGKVIFNSMHPIGNVLNFDAKNEYQNRGPQHTHFLCMFMVPHKLMLIQI